MTIECINGLFSVCKTADFSQVDWTDTFCFLAKTDEECSVVCRTERVPSNTIAREDGWRCFRIQGTLDFSLVGILAPIASLLAACRISIFAVSTYNTDYLLVKNEQFDTATAALKQAGYSVQ